MDPGFSAGASMHAGSFSFGLMPMLKAAVYDLGLVGVIPKWFATPVEAILGVPLLNYLFLVAAIPLIVLFLVFDAPRPKKIAVTCDIITVPELLRRFSGKEAAPVVIDFLKIDVEGAEWDVLLGISDDLWASIQQMVVEVHNLENGTRVEAVKTLLRSKGFTNVVLDDEEFKSHKILDISTVFATKQAPKLSNTKK
jgi:hypothetical protein